MGTEGNEVCSWPVTTGGSVTGRTLGIVTPLCCVVVCGDLTVLVELFGLIIVGDNEEFGLRTKKDGLGAFEIYSPKNFFR